MDRLGVDMPWGWKILYSEMWVGLLDGGCLKDVIEKNQTNVESGRTLRYAELVQLQAAFGTRNIGSVRLVEALA
jgi:hypothetical protein